MVYEKLCLSLGGKLVYIFATDAEGVEDDKLTVGETKHLVLKKKRQSFFYTLQSNKEGYSMELHTNLITLH